MANSSFHSNQLLNLDQQILWEKISAFQIDESGIEFPFSKRLAAENGWTDDYTCRVIHEYKKFLFLCCLSSGVTPSGDVDQAWHLHLTYTQSYWTELCRNTLGRDIHHTPTRGGEQEAEKYSVAYLYTLDLYKRKFGEEPPAAIWPAVDTRFSQSRYRRVNLETFWLLKRPFGGDRRKGAAASIIFLALLWVAAGLMDPHFWPVSCYMGVMSVGAAIQVWLVGPENIESKSASGSRSCDGEYPSCSCS